MQSFHITVHYFLFIYLVSHSCYNLGSKPALRIHNTYAIMPLRHAEPQFLFFSNSVDPDLIYKNTQLPATQIGVISRTCISCT